MWVVGEIIGHIGMGVQIKRTLVYMVWNKRHEGGHRIMQIAD